MKKTLLNLAIGLGVLISSANAQYYYLKGTGSNPGSLNTDAEYPQGGGLPSGWSSIDGGSASSARWSANQAVPFVFRLNGGIVQQYKVSTSGVLTFDVNTVLSAPAYGTKASLPNSNVPNNSVCIWGLAGIGANDAILTKTFGSAPNRQLWIMFNSYSYGTTASDNSNYCYWSIVLEETSNKIYVVDQRSYGFSGTNNVSSGIQIDGTEAYMVTGSPTLTALATSDPTPADNVSYMFIQGTQPALKAVLTNETAGLISANQAAGLPIKVSAYNMGYLDMTSTKINYSVNAGATVTGNLNGFTIAKSGGTGVLTSPTNFVPVAADKGTTKTLKVWLTDMNGLGSNSDTVTSTFFVNEGISGTKKVMFEEGSGAWCGYCPDGHRVVRDMEANPTYAGKFSAVIHHNSDGLINTESDILNTAYATGYPTGWIDRKKFDDQTTLSMSRNLWEGKIATQMNEVTPVNISIVNKTYNAATRVLNYDVKVDFVDYGLAGDMRINTMIVEDYCRGPYTGPTSTTWTQHNYYSKDDAQAGGTTHPLYNEPGYMVGYYHQHAVRDIPSGAWGTPGVITTVAKGDSYTQHYQYLVPTESQVDYSVMPAELRNVSELQSTNNGLGINKPGNTYIVAFVSYYNADPNKRVILNATDDSDDDNGLFNTGVVEKTNNVSISSVNPSPTSGITRVDFNLNATDKNVTVEVVDILGKTIMTPKENAGYAAGTQSVFFDASELKGGIYFVNVKTSEGIATLKFVVSR